MVHIVNDNSAEHCLHRKQAMTQRAATDSGVVVYPRLPVPKAGGDEVAAPGQQRKALHNRRKSAAIVAAVSAAAAAAGFVARPHLAPDPQLERLGAELRAVQEAKAATEAKLKTVADQLASTAANHQRELNSKAELVKELNALQRVQAEAATAKTSTAARMAVLAEKLAPGFDGKVAKIGTAGDYVFVRIPDKQLFASKSTELTKSGITMLERFASRVTIAPSDVSRIEVVVPLGEMDLRESGAELERTSERLERGSLVSRRAKSTPAVQLRVQSGAQISVLQAAALTSYIAQHTALGAVKLTAAAMSSTQGMVEIRIYPAPQS